MSEENPSPPLHVDIVLDGTRRRIDVQPGETVLQAARRAGIEPPTSCESGFCGCCMAKLAAGKVHMLVNDFLGARELEEGWVLTCQAVPEDSDVVIEYPE